MCFCTRCSHLERGHHFALLYLAVTCSEFARGVQDYGLSWEMTSGIISVFSAMPGSTADTCSGQSTEASGIFTCLSSCRWTSDPA